MSRLRSATANLFFDGTSRESAALIPLSQRLHIKASRTVRCERNFQSLTQNLRMEDIQRQLRREQVANAQIPGHAFRQNPRIQLYGQVPKTFNQIIICRDQETVSCKRAALPGLEVIHVEMGDRNALTVFCTPPLAS